MLSATGWWLAVAPVDLRCGMDRLLVTVGEVLGQDVRAGGAFVFRNRAGTRIKVLCVDAHGVWLSTRRLHQGRFHWPRAGDGAWALTPEQFGWLIAGVDWQRLSTQLMALPKLI
ncbi:MAG TPA: IS66 family insertion sequence element accessory protein TnpB [Rudaea sp.]|nr:IS66 family insertion sequence element accessory protein TnpB [Rudaea sp.]